MSKENVERFKISCETDVTSLGPVMSALAKIPGLNITGSELVTDVRGFRSNTRPEIKSTEFLTKWIETHPTFKAKEAVVAFREDGRGNGTTAYPALGALVEQGVLKKIGDGMYSRTDVKALAPPKKNKQQAVAERKTFTKRGEDVIITYAKRNHGRFNTAKLIEVFAKEGRAKNSVYASIDQLMKNKLCKRVGDSGSGQYILLSKAASKPKSRPKAAASPPAPAVSALNGGEATHG